MLRKLTINVAKCRRSDIADSCISKYRRFSSGILRSSTTSSLKEVNAMAQDKSSFLLPNNQRFVELESSQAFNNLTKQEKLYAHYLSQAAWNGGLIVLMQTSPESPRIFSLVHRIFLAEPLNNLKASALKAGVTEDDFKAFLVYAGALFANSGNYKGFGDTKFIPNLSKDTFETIIKSSKAYENDTHISKLWQHTKDAIYSLSPRLTSLGLADKGVTTYFSSNCTEKDSNLVNEWMKTKRIEAYICRTFKTTADDGLPLYTIHLASVETSPKPPLTMEKEKFRNAYFQVTRGDYSPLLKLVTNNLAKAQEYAANDNEKNMLKHYINSFNEGDLDEHKEGSRFWIKDKGPIIETYQGFIETYRDPTGQRGEFEGFVSMVNKEMSKKFGDLVNGAERFIKMLPWGKDLEKDSFLRPDFTSLDVLTFSGSGIPAGINIPNYDEIRQNEGFKNVNVLRNVIPAAYKEAVIPFLSAEDKQLLEKYRVAAFEVQVGLHELLGHGSGKLLRQNEDKSFNFDKNKVLKPLTGKPIESWYMEGETYDSKFTTLGSAFEECRAEAVGLYLSLVPEILKIFGYEGKEAENVIYVNWLSLLWNGCAKATEMYQPSTKTWLQAHARARFVLMRLLELEGDGLLTVSEVEPGKNLLMTLQRDRLATDGKKIIGDFLVKLQTIKATGDVAAGNMLFDKYSAVEGTWADWRNIVLLHKQPRNIFVQPNTTVSGDTVTLKRYPATAEGMAASWIERFPDTAVDDILEGLANADKKYFAELEALLA